MKRLIVYGSCQVQEMGRILERSAAVRAEYDVRIHWIGEQFANTEAWAHEIAEADLVLLQDVPELVSYPLWHWNQSRARFIRFPYLTLPGLWPFDSMRGGVDAKALAMQAAGHGGGFQFQDRLLSRMRLYIADPDERFEAYRTLSAPRYPQVAAYLAKFEPASFFAQRAAALRRQDRHHELSIGGAILGQLAHSAVFHTPTHPTATILRRLTGELLGKAGIQLEPQSDLSDGFAHYQIPVHPAVARALGLTWAPDARLWRFHDRRVTFEEYYRQYIAVFG